MDFVEVVGTDWKWVYFYNIVKEELIVGGGYIFLIEEIMLGVIISIMEQEEKVKEIEKKQFELGKELGE